MDLYPVRRKLSVLKHGPRFLLSDLHAVRNEYRIRKGIVRWPLKSLFEVIWIDSDSVIGTMKNGFSRRFAGCHMPGDWDRDFVNIEDTIDYYFMYNRFVEGKDWEKIISDYQEEHGKLRTDYRNKIMRRSAERDNLYRDLKESGWKLSRNLKDSLLFTDELTVNITRDGSCIRNYAGMHRLIISRFAGIEKVPCRLHVVHSEFYNKEIHT
ncbi:hypothetical protein [Natronogracilivirga saccharolytica]|uniref:Uncharacterized protein n=1 Tax=Natronogracilivirga saccharolytica TaxID=2812953 RepID=A0A8J7UUT6_9BACT|nr:hypothetical protein [Natronogracilivirga saccharolytica]MBP3193956.1 hypothetical protein [Natronogracilivirga saccharolytica]